MPTITNFAEAQDALRPFYDNSRTVYTLDNMLELMDFLGNPQEKLRVIHVAGTSGKTSTAYYTAALLKESGYSVGLSVSPHVDTVNERIQINGQPLPELEFCRDLGEFLDLIEPCGVKPSYFELLVAMAYWEFARRKLDFVVVEVGLGGLLDGTNVVKRSVKICVITDIGLDHTEILGNTIEKIAAQKAGIIQPGNQVFMHVQADGVMKVVREFCKKQKATLYEVEPTSMWLDAQYWVDDQMPDFQIWNIELAAEVVRHLLQSEDKYLADSAIYEASLTRIPARLEKIGYGSYRMFIVDGAHNQQKLQASMQELARRFRDRKIAALVAFVEGNDERWQGGLDEILPHVERIVFTGFKSEQDVPKQSIDPKILAEYARGQGFKNITIEAEPAKAFEVLKQSSEPILLITGSFYLLNHIRPLIREQV